MRSLWGTDLLNRDALALQLINTGHDLDRVWTRYKGRHRVEVQLKHLGIARGRIRPQGLLLPPAAAGAGHRMNTNKEGAGAHDTRKRSCQRASAWQGTNARVAALTR